MAAGRFRPFHAQKFGSFFVDFLGFLFLFFFVFLFFLVAAQNGRRPRRKSTTAAIERPLLSTRAVLRRVAIRNKKRRLDTPVVLALGFALRIALGMVGRVPRPTEPSGSQKQEPSRHTDTPVVLALEFALRIALGMVGRVRGPRGPLRLIDQNNKPGKTR